METSRESSANGAKALQAPVILGLRAAFLLAVVVALLVLALRHGGEEQDLRMPSGIPRAKRLGLPSRPEHDAGAARALPAPDPEASPTDLATRPVDRSAPAAAPEGIARAAGEPEPPDGRPSVRDSGPRPPPTETHAGRPPEPEPEEDTAAAQAGGEKRAQADPEASGTSDDPAPVTAEAEKIDWSQYEITGPVPRANIVIYVKGRVLLLRSHADHVRIYRRIGVPEDASAPKREAGDKRAPLGQYRITRREKTADGFRLHLNYPALQDAKQAKEAGRIDQETFDRIAAAARARKHPPQDTPLGGGICIAGAPDAARTTEKRFLLRPGEIEELWRATRLGTPVTLVP